MKKVQNKWWMWRSWLTRQFVALETVGSSPIFHPIKNYGKFVKQILLDKSRRLTS